MAIDKRQPRAGLPAYLLLSGGLLFSGIGSGLCVAQAKLYSEPVTDADLAATSAEDWLSFRGNLASWGYSALDQIDRSNVDRLAFAWSATMATGPNEPSPPIRDGILYLPHSGDVIQALECSRRRAEWEPRSATQPSSPTPQGRSSPTARSSVAEPAIGLFPAAASSRPTIPETALIEVLKEIAFEEHRA